MIARRPRRRRRARQAGFTLIELMISLVMFSFAIAGVLAVAVAMASGYREQKQAIGAEGSSRAAMDYIGDAIRGASPGVLPGSSSTLEDLTTCEAGVFTVLDSATGPDSLTVTFATGSVVTSSQAVFSDGDTTLTVADTAQFAAGDWALITDYAVGHLLKITAVTDATHLDVASPGSCSHTVAFPTSGYRAGALVVRAMRARFFIQPLDNVPTLWMDPDNDGTMPAEPLAEGIEDMQIELGIDPNNDGILEDGSTGDEWIYNNASDTAPALTDTIRAVRITLIARSVAPVGGVGNFTLPAAGDRPLSTTPDNFRRRTLSSMIEIRNAGGSP